MSTYDETGRPYAKLSELKAGDIIELGEGFTCCAPGKARIEQGTYGLYFPCSEGQHYLKGQADDGEHCIGVYLSHG